MADTRIALTGQPVNIMLPSEAIQRAERNKEARMRNALMQGEMQQQQELDSAYRASGGDINAMAENPNIGFGAGMELRKMQASQQSAAEDAQAAAIDRQMKAIEFGSNLLSGATDQASWDSAKQQLSGVLGADAVARLPAEYSEAARDQIVMQGMSAKDRLAIAREQRMADLQAYRAGLDERRVSAMEARAYGNQGAEPKATYDPNLRAYVRPDGTMTPVVDQSGVAVVAKPSSSGSAPKLSSAAEKEMFEAEDVSLAAGNVVNAIDQALALNQKAYSGIGAAERATLRSNLPGSSDEADATVNMNNIIMGQALESLKATFGGSPTEGERRILIELQASVDKTPKQREDILTRAKQAAENRKKYNQKKAESIRTGEYRERGFDAYSDESAPPQKTVVRTGTQNGRKVVQYSDGSVDYAD